MRLIILTIISLLLTSCSSSCSISVESEPTKEFESYVVTGEIVRVDYSNNFFSGHTYYITIDMGDYGITTIDRSRLIGLEGAMIECQVNTSADQKRLEKYPNFFLKIGLVEDECKRIPKSNKNIK